MGYGWEREGGNGEKGKGGKREMREGWGRSYLFRSGIGRERESKLERRLGNQLASAEGRVQVDRASLLKGQGIEVTGKVSKIITPAVKYFFHLQ